MLSQAHHTCAVARKSEGRYLERLTIALSPVPRMTFCEGPIGEKLVVYHGLLQMAEYMQGRIRAGYNVW